MVLKEVVECENAREESGTNFGAGGSLGEDIFKPC